MGVKKDIILEQNRLRHYETYMAEHGLPDIRTAQQEMEVMYGHTLAHVLQLA